MMLATAMAMAMSRVGNLPHNLLVWRRNFAGKVKKCRPVTCASVSPSDWRESRRLVSISLVLAHSLLIPHRTNSLFHPSVLFARKFFPSRYISCFLLISEKESNRGAAR